MNIARYIYDPFNTSLTDLQKEMGRMFNQHLANLPDNSTVETSQWSPLVDIQEQADKFVIMADIPGIPLDEIEIAMEDNVLTIKGQRQNTVEKQEGKWTRVERTMGSFYRRFSLPDTADVEKIKARGEHGVLEITIPKREKAQPKRIKIEKSK